MKCREARVHILQDGAPDSNVRAALDSHLDSCASCRALRDDISSAIESWRVETREARIPDSGIEWQKLRRTIRQSPARRRGALPWVALPLAAAAALTIGIYVSQDRREAAAPPAAEPLVTGRAAPAAAPSSTVVYVDDKSGWTFVWASENPPSRRI